MKYVKYITRLEIDWIDSGYLKGFQGWKSKKDIEYEIKNNNWNELCKTIGYYIGEDELKIFVCMGQSDINVYNVAYIVKKAIIKIRVLK